MKIGWYLFDHEPFRSTVGIFQILCALLLLIDRTVMIGAFLFLPIASTILLIDMTIMGPTTAFTWRLSYYIILDILILFYYKDRLKTIWHALWEKITRTPRFSWWAYLLLPLSIVVLEILGVLPNAIIAFVRNPSETVYEIGRLINLVLDKI